jgi:branched-chain amino acid transport system ATP-binding protein
MTGDTAAPLLEIRDLDAGYGHVSVLRNVSMAVRMGTIVALVGSNGAGKSTLLKTISGLIRPTRGSIGFGGEAISNVSPGGIVDRGLLHVAEGRKLFRSQSVEDNLDLGLYGTKLSKAEEARRYERVFSLFPILAERRAVPAGILSGGQQQMLTIGQALMRDPRLLMLDEPSLGLAPIIVEQVLDTVVKLRSEGITILLVEQMVELALQIADHAYILQNGAMIGDGPAKDFSGSALLRQAYLGPAAVA